MAKANGYPGLYGVFDGIIGCGKSKQIELLKTNLQLDFPELKFLFTYEPGGNSEADIIRQDLKHRIMLPEEEMRLFAKSRSITLPQVVLPAIREGAIVISDRSVTTSLAYQAFGRELGLKKVWRVNERAVNGIFPDFVIWMNVGLETCLKRSGGENPDKFDQESREFWHRTIAGYGEMLRFLRKLNPEIKTIQIDDPEGSLGIEEMGLEIRSHLYPIIEAQTVEGRILRERQV
jgi:dTMP kinase